MRTALYQRLSISTAVEYSLAASLLAACLAGCGGSEFGASVKGVVTLDGNPVTPGLVTFAPEDPAAVPAVSDLDSNGNYMLTTNKKPGLAPGKYRVAIQAFRPPNLAPGERTTKPSERLVPDKYFDVNTSSLEFTVAPGANEHNIELTSK